MAPRAHARIHRRSRVPGRATGAFTLLEMLLVVAIMATIAGLVAASFQGTHEQVGRDLAEYQLGEVRRAVRQFHADTGSLPKQGTFAQANCVRPAYVDAGEFPTWFQREENLWQLFEYPLGTDTTGLWNAGRRRGWNGPYLTQNGAARLRIGAAAALPAVPDPFVHVTSLHAWFRWEDPSASLPELPEGARRRAVRLEGLDDPNQARVVSAGPDGLYDPLGTPGSDDIVLFILR